MNEVKHMAINHASIIHDIPFVAILTAEGFIATWRFSPHQSIMDDLLDILRNGKGMDVTIFNPPRKEQGDK